jgi:hypothetical protein
MDLGINKRSLEQRRVLTLAEEKTPAMTNIAGVDIFKQNG